MAYFGSGSGPIHLDYVVCSGTEYSLTDCQTGNETRQSSHSEDVGVKCQTSKICIVNKQTDKSLCTLYLMYKADIAKASFKSTLPRFKLYIFVYKPHFQKDP